MSEGNSILSCTDLQRYLGVGEKRTRILHGIDLELEPSKIYAITGPSGCGKSTLLYTLGLLDKEDAGEIWIRNQKVSGASDVERTRIRNRTIGFVFQFHFLLSEFTALENLLLPMRKLGDHSEKVMKERALELLESVGLADKCHRLANQLSGGEQQRVAIARALANNPPILLADEPTGNLDQQNSIKVVNLLARLAHEHGHTVLLVTHNPQIAEACDQQLPMLDGKFLDSV
jgi:lipoprotein-releasing system ATP-binding protein